MKYPQTPGVTTRETQLDLLDYWRISPVELSLHLLPWSM
jgi:hypothetical protein